MASKVTGWALRMLDSAANPQPLTCCKDLLVEVGSTVLVEEGRLGAQLEPDRVPDALVDLAEAQVRPHHHTLKAWNSAKQF